MNSFFGFFAYRDSETASCKYSTYFTGITLEQELLTEQGPLPVGYTCNEAYLDHRHGTLTFVKSWRCRVCKQEFLGGYVCCARRGGVLEEHVSFALPVASLFTTADQEV